MTTDTERQEERTYETTPERIAAMEATQRLLIEVVRENGRRADENYKALDAKIEATAQESRESYRTLDAKIDSKFETQDAKIDSNYKALDAKIDSNYKALDAKIDDLNKHMRRLYYAVIVSSISVAAAIIGANYFGN